ncbi:CDP-glucose 4,6-dehydratase [Sulfitobacter sp. SK012]|uniref:CDP-glucose 4,6-dehydratase n=1 Tax=Sulfitobacter sp. SK012 TaxID=1389005 RepID=UPI000E0B29A1|nr:CDP-glucose 4,6-dehydratase [Sulfitobacter sp. SK012]AXI48170.1 CDP-glucose 4,6-dehydratase [Sulfitobacter sp. SK012]
MELISFWKDKSVFLTGHTGFKGAWMALLLSHMGARVTGYSLAPESSPNLFELCGVADKITDHQIADIRDVDALQKSVAKAQPEVIFHLAAQSLVRRSYSVPVETFEINVMGTAHVLEATRQLPYPCAVVAVTTDKVYENPERIYPFREIDPLGAADPYSTSKAAAELVIATWSKSFAPKNGHGMRIASVRAGNVIGGGDWAKDRLVPDCIRAFVAGDSAQIRNPTAVRPWQHVLDPINGYLVVAEHMMQSMEHIVQKPAWNFGPDLRGEASALAISERAALLWGDGASLEVSPQADAPLEANLLRLDSSKAMLELGWTARWDLDRTIDETIRWYKAWADGKDMAAFTQAQIANFIDQQQGGH